MSSAHTRGGGISRVSDILGARQLSSETSGESCPFEFAKKNVRMAQFHVNENRTVSYGYKKETAQSTATQKALFLFSLFTLRFYFLRGFDKNRTTKCNPTKDFRNHLAPLLCWMRKLKTENGEGQERGQGQAEKQRQTDAGSWGPGPRAGAGQPPLLGVLAQQRHAHPTTHPHRPVRCSAPAHAALWGSPPPCGPERPEPGLQTRGYSTAVTELACHRRQGEAPGREALPCGVLCGVGGSAQSRGCTCTSLRAAPGWRAGGDHRAKHTACQVGPSQGSNSQLSVSFCYEVRVHGG